MAHRAPHVGFVDQIIAVRGRALPHSHFSFNESMGVSSVLLVAFLTKGEVITLGTIIPKMTFFDWL